MTMFGIPSHQPNNPCSTRILGVPKRYHSHKWGHEKRLIATSTWLGSIFLFMQVFCSGVYGAAPSPLSNGPWGPLDPVADPAAVILVVGPNNHKIRITVLTDRLLRIERAANAENDHDASTFEDRKTIAVMNRKLPVPAYKHSVSEDGILTVETKCLTLTYHTKQEFLPSSLHVQGQMDCFSKNTNHHNSTASSSSWTYHYGQSDPHNLLGTIRTLDQRDATSLNCSHLRDDNHCEFGLISKSGFAIVNDTLNYALDGQDWWDGPNSDQEDIYIFGHGHDYAAALYDYRLIGGYIPLLPRYALGVWFSRWYDYAATDIVTDVIDKYEQFTIPLDVFVLDMNWHTKNDWTGYSWDRRLFPIAGDELSAIKARGLAVTLNLHDANGVHPWEERFQDMCRAIGGGTCDDGGVIPFSIVNQTIAYALEDTVLQPLEHVGVDFWWIDWQQGEKGKGGAAGAKQNPTIWTAHVRSTNVNRRRVEGEQEEIPRSMVLARWGGLGAHRYPVHFSGDVLHLTWDNLAYQPYFSMTAINVGAIWSHDITGPSQDLELYTRWLQWGVVSGVMRSHDRGLAAGACADSEPNTCSVVVPWDVPPKFAKANLQALRLRGSLIPYLYTAAYAAHLSGRWFTTPFYYRWPELDGAYETASPRPDPTARYDSQYLFGDDIWVAPVVKPANQSTGLAQMKLWIPPGKWIGIPGGQVLDGKDNGIPLFNYTADLSDIPMFARAGSIIPTIKVRSGNTIGLAMKPIEELIWSVYLAQGAPQSGSGTVYEDDGATSAYYERDSSTITTAIYNISTSSFESNLPVEENARKLPYARLVKSLSFTVSTSGHCERLPTSRATIIRLVNSLPPSRVDANGLSIPYARFGGPNTWTYKSKESAVVIELISSKVSEGLQVTVDGVADDGKIVPDGIGFQLERAIAAKAALDEAQLTPGSQTGEDKFTGNLLLAASSASSLEYWAGENGLEFQSVLARYPSYPGGAIKKLQQMKSVGTKKRNRIARAIALLQSTL